MSNDILAAVNFAIKVHGTEQLNGELMLGYLTRVAQNVSTFYEHYREKLSLVLDEADLIVLAYLHRSLESADITSSIADTFDVRIGARVVHFRVQEFEQMDIDTKLVSLCARLETLERCVEQKRWDFNEAKQNLLAIASLTPEVYMSIVGLARLITDRCMKIIEQGEPWYDSNSRSADTLLQFLHERGNEKLKTLLLTIGYY